MGVDISGRNPQLKSERPQIDWETSSEEAKKMYFDAVDKWEEENPGDYFRSNWWGWRPIVCLVDAACETYGMKVDTSSWHFNDGAGPETQEECDSIADALEFMLSIDGNPLQEDDDYIYACMGSWSTTEGRFVENDMEEKLNEQYPPGTVLTNSVVTPDSQVVQPSHGTSLGHIKRFIKFLRNCGGFQVF